MFGVIGNLKSNKEYYQDWKDVYNKLTNESTMDDHQEFIDLSKELVDTTISTLVFNGRDSAQDTSDSAGDAFFANVLQNVSRKITTSVPAAMAVGVENGGVSLFVNPYKLAELTTDERHIMGILKHECYHLIFQHLYIYQDFMTKKRINRTLMNLATDCQINQLLSHLPEGTITLAYIEKLVGKNLERHGGSAYYLEELVNSQFAEDLKNREQQLLQALRNQIKNSNNTPKSQDEKDGYKDGYAQAKQDLEDALNKSNQQQDQDTQEGQGQDTQDGQNQGNQDGQNQGNQEGQGQDTQEGQGQDTQDGQNQGNQEGQGQDTQEGQGNQQGQGNKYKQGNSEYDKGYEQGYSDALNNGQGQQGQGQGNSMFDNDLWGDAFDSLTDEEKQTLLDEMLAHDSWDTPKSEGGKDVVREFVGGVLRDAYNKLTDKQRGLLPSDLSSAIEALNEKPAVNWKSLIRRGIGMIPVPHKKTKNRLNRRQPDRIELRGRLNDRMVKVVVAFDTSGSVSDEELQYALAETQNLLKGIRSTIDVVMVDAEVKKVYKNVKDVKTVTVHGRGGTWFTPFFKYLKENKHTDQDTLAVYFTDGYGESEKDLNRYGFNNVYWVITGDSATVDQLSCDGRGRVALLKDDPNLNRKRLKK